MYTKANSILEELSKSDEANHSGHSESVDKFCKKYGAEDVKTYYSNFDAAITADLSHAA